MILDKARKIAFGWLLMLASFNIMASGLQIGQASAYEVFNHDANVIALIKAAVGHDALTAKRLVQSGADINAAGKAGITPLLSVQADNDMPAVLILLELGADPNKYEAPGHGERGFGPPVWVAAVAGRKEMLHVLLQHGGNPNIVYSTGTALMMAVRESHLDCAQLLLGYGANLNLTVGRGSALKMTMIYDRFSDSVWVLVHGFNADLIWVRGMLAMRKPRPGQEEMKAKALSIIDERLAEQGK